MTAASSRRDYAGAREEELIEWAKENDRDAFDALYNMHQAKVRGHIRAQTCNDEDMEIAEGDTWLRAWEQIHKYDRARASFLRWVKMLAGFALLDYYRAEERWDRVHKLVSDLTDVALELEGMGGPEGGVAAVPDSRTGPEESDIPPEVYEKLLCTTFNSDVPPHQLTAFGFSKLLGYPPRRVVAEMSNISLRELEKRLENEYLDKSQLPEHKVRPCFKRLRENLERRFEKVVKAKTRNTYPNLVGKLVGDTVLEDYFEDCATDKERAAKISQWSASVARRVLRDLARAASMPDSREHELQAWELLARKRS